MANEEQRKAFASYMGTAGTSAGQQTPQYSSGYASSGNPYQFQVSLLKQQFLGVSGLPTAPTPPPAAPSSVASYPSYTSGFQGGIQGTYQAAYPQTGQQAGGFQQNGLPQRPPPLGQSEGFPSQQSQSQSQSQSQHQQATQLGYGQASGIYTNLSPYTQSYNTGAQYTSPVERQNGQVNGGAMMPSSRNFPGEVVETRERYVDEQFRFHSYEQPRPQEAPAPHDHNVPVLLCHTCSICAQRRSARYHHQNPVVPGIPLVLTPCGRCKKRIKKERHSISRITRVRSCTAEKPCDWPREDVQIDMEYHEDRGRRRSRDVVYVYMDSPNRPHIIRQSSSQTRLGLRVLQQGAGGQHEIISTIQMSSLSPRRAAMYVELHPLPDVLNPKQSKQKEQGPPPPCKPEDDAFGNVWPRPDGIYAHLHRKVNMDPPRRPSSRIEELPESPPPRAGATRVEFRSESVECRYRSVSPPRVIYRQERKAEDAEALLKQHPQPFHIVHPNERKYRTVSGETSTITAERLYHERRGRRESPSRGILKTSADERETLHRRQTMRESQESTAVNLGGARVHFDSHQREAQQASLEGRGRPRHVEIAPRGEDFELYHSYARHQSPVKDFERLHIRQRSPSPRQVIEEIHIDRGRRISPSPPRHVEDLHIRHVRPLPPSGPERERVTRPPPSPERPVHVGFRHVSRERFVRRERSVTPHAREKPASDDMTDTDSAHSGELIETRTFTAIDENGKPVTYVEERRRHRAIEQGGERSGQVEFRALNERAPQLQRIYRDV